MYIKNLLHISRLFYTKICYSIPDNDLSWLSNFHFFRLNGHGLWYPKS